MASVTYDKCILIASVTYGKGIMASVIMAKVLWQIKMSRKFWERTKSIILND